MADPVEVKAFADWVLEHGVPDIIVNNAGQFVPGSVHNEAAGALEQMLQVNLFSAYHLTRALLPKMMEAKRGHIFNICSIASLRAYQGGGSYGVSKYAMLGFTRNLRLELMNHGIKVTAV
ncbi:MAG: SDR family NAD(P)-dependent oxidoreductase, partial [Methylophilaceae bacterium]